MDGVRKGMVDLPACAVTTLTPALILTVTPTITFTLTQVDFYLRWYNGAHAIANGYGSRK